jgi:PAS domain S-box-containing protein
MGTADSSSGNPLTVLVVEDEAVIAADVVLRLRSFGCNVLGTAATCDEAISKARTLLPDVILMDIRLKGPRDGIAAATAIKAERDVPIVFATSYSDSQTIDRANAGTPSAIIFKPYNEADLKTTLTLAVQRHRMDLKLRESEARYRALFENNVAGVFRTSLDAEILDCNSSMARILGYDQLEELLHLSVVTFYADQHDRGKIIADLRTHQKVTQREMQLRRRDGSTTWVILSLHLQQDKTVIGTAIDISRRRQLEDRLKEQLDMQQILIDTIPVPVFVRDTESKYRACNTAFEQFFGRKRTEIVGKHVSEILPRAYADVFSRSDAELVAHPGKHSYEALTLDGSGIERPVMAHKATITDVHGNVVGVVGVLFDLTEQRQLQRRLRESEEHYRQIFNNSSAVTLLIDPDSGAIADANPAAAKFYGFSDEQLQSMRIQEFSLASADILDKAMQRARQGQQSLFTDRQRTASGEFRYVELFTGPLELDGVVFLHTYVHDVTAHRAAEKALRESELRFRLISENVNDLIMMVSLDGTVIYCSPSIAQYDLPPEAIIGNGIAGFIHPADLDLVNATLRRTAEEFLDEVLMFRVQDRLRGWRTVEASMSLLIADDAPCVLAVARDITDRLRQDKELQALRLAIEQSPVAVVITDTDGTITYVNPAFSLNSGYSAEEALGNTPRLLRSPVTNIEVYSSLWNTILAGRVWHGNMCNKRKDGSLYWERSHIAPVVEKDGTITRFIALKEDITEQVRYEEDRVRFEKELKSRNEELENAVTGLRQMQDTLVQSEKLASIGQLTAGIAHEINNPLSFVASNLNRFDEYFSDVISLLDGWRAFGTTAPFNGEGEGSRAHLHAEEERLDLPYIKEDFRRLMGHTRSGAERIKLIVEQLRGFTHLAGEGFADTNLNEALEDTITIVWNELKYKATLVKEFGALPPVTCNAGEVKQVFVNLLVNAAHAIEVKGTITIRTSAENGMVQIEIEDNGCGIAVAHMKKIFDPFFTTKPVGKGTGLGLWISTTIIQKHHGSIAVRSDVGKGTVFTVRLPVQGPQEEEMLGE